jgi:hypothetical protein
MSQNIDNKELNYNFIKIFIATSGFDPKPVRVGFVVDGVSVGYCFYEYCGVSCHYQLIYAPYTFLHLSPTSYYIVLAFYSLVK